MVQVEVVRCMIVREEVINMAFRRRRSFGRKRRSFGGRRGYSSRRGRSRRPSRRLKIGFRM